MSLANKRAVKSATFKGVAPVFSFLLVGKQPDRPIINWFGQKCSFLSVTQKYNFALFLDNKDWLVLTTLYRLGGASQDSCPH